MIIILGKEKEAHCAYIARKLSALNEKIIFFDTREFPSRIKINWYVNSENDCYLTIGDNIIDCNDIKGIYWRNYYGITYQKIGNDKNCEYLSKIVMRERESAIISLFYSLNLNWVNSIKAFELHKKKAYITSLLTRNGIRVPKTLITNNKDYVNDFLEKNNGQIIVKPVLGGAYTEKITKDNLTIERLEKLSFSPVQFQEYIQGTDIRVYAFKNDIFSVMIKADTIDFRADKNAKLIPCNLPDDVKKTCFKIMNLLDLKYTGIDIRLNKNGEYVFIEANPAPMFIHVEEVTGFPLSDSLINILRNK